MGFILKKATTTAITIALSIDTDQGKIEGSFVGHARILTKADAKKTLDSILEQAERGEIADADAALVRAIYDRFEGLENESGKLIGEAAFVEILDGQFSAFLTPAVIRAFYEAIGEVARGNSKPSRRR